MLFVTNKAPDAWKTPPPKAEPPFNPKPPATAWHELPLQLRNASVTAGNRVWEMPSFSLALYVYYVRYILYAAPKIRRFDAPQKLFAPTRKALARYQGLPVRSSQALHPSQLRRLRQRRQTSCFPALFHRPGPPPLYVCARRVGAAVAASPAQWQSPRSSALPTGA